MVKVGLCGFTIGAAEYYETFPLVEVQQTFYQPPAAATLARWRDQAPAAFEFTLKAWQLITHRAESRTYRRTTEPLSPAERTQCGAFQDTPVVRRAWQRTRDCARALRATAVLFQCPASFRPVTENVDNLRRFFAALDRPPSLRLLWEPRGPWEDELVTRLCRELGLVHVVDPWQRTSLTPELTYWRLHGIRNHYHTYSDAELRSLRDRLPGNGDCYVLFNNVPRAGDAVRFLRLLAAPRAPVH
jgi:uncharacterized protein YecE (DUF72 family)